MLPTYTMGKFPKKKNPSYTPRKSKHNLSTTTQREKLTSNIPRGGLLRHPMPRPTTLGPRVRLKMARRSQGRRGGWEARRVEATKGKGKKMEKGVVFIEKGKPAKGADYCKLDHESMG